MKRYQFELNGETIFKNVSPGNEDMFFNKYGQYNPTLVSDEPGKSKGTSQSQDNQQQENTESKSESGSSESLANKFQIKPEDNKLTKIVKKKMLNTSIGRMAAASIIGAQAWGAVGKGVKDSVGEERKKEKEAYKNSEATYLAVSPKKTKSETPLEYQTNNKGRRMYYKSGGSDATGTNIEPGYYKEVGYDYDRSQGVRFAHDSYGKFLDNIAYSVGIGIQGMQSGDYTAEMTELMQKGNVDEMTEEDAARITRLMEEQDRAPKAANMENWIKTMNKESNPFLGFIRATVAYPSTTLTITSQSIAGMVAANKSEELVGISQSVGVTQGLATGVKTKSIKLGIAAYIRGVMSTLGGGVEATSKFGELIRQEFGGEIPSEQELLDFLQDEKKYKKFRNKAILKGATIATVDNIGGAIVQNSVLKTAKTGRKLAAAGKGLVGETITGGGGEALSSVVIGEKVDAADVGLEILGQGGQAVVDIGSALNPGKYVINKGRDNEETVSFSKMQEILDSATDEEIADMNIEITNNDFLEAKVKGKEMSGLLTAGVDAKVVDQAERKRIARLKIKLARLNAKKKQRQDRLKKLGLDTSDTDVNLENEIAEVEGEIIQSIEAYTELEGTNIVEQSKPMLERLADKKFKGNLKFAQKHSSLYGLEYTEMTYDEVLAEFGEDAANNSSGFVDPKTGRLIINLDVAKNVNDITVGNHELLHGILRKALKDGDINIKLISQLKLKLKDQFKKVEEVIQNEYANLTGEVTREQAERYGLDVDKLQFNDKGLATKYKDGTDVSYMDANPDEYLTILSDLIYNEQVTIDQSTLQSLMQPITDLIRSISPFSKVRFGDADAVLDFLREYNKSIHKGALSSRIQRGTGARTNIETDDTGAKFKRVDAKPAVDDLAVDPNTKKNYTQQEWDRVGADRAIEQFKVKREEFENQGYLDGLIAAKYKVKLAYDELQSFVADVLGSNEFINMIKRFNRGKRNTPDENDSLFGYIQGQLRFRADDVFKEAERGRVPKGTKTVEADARTTEGQPKTQLEDTDTSFERIDNEEINLRDTKVQDSKLEVRERKSKFRAEIGITRKGRIFREVKKALRTAESIVNPKKFLNTFEKTVSDALFDFMKVYFPDTNSMIKYRAAILESIPVTTLVQMQKQLAEKIFVKSYGRLTNKTQLSDFVYGRNESGKNPGKKKLLTKDILDDSEISKARRKAGVQVYERLKPTSTQWQNYLNATEKGKRQIAQKSGTKGNNRIKILEESAKAIGRDATPENLTTDFLEDYIQEKGLQDVLTVEQVREEINKIIDRPADLKFKRTSKQKADNLNRSANKKINKVVSDNGVTLLEVEKRIQEYVGRKSGKIKSRTIVDFVKSSKLAKDIEKHIGGFLSTHPEYIPFFQDSMTGGYDNGLFGIKDIFYKVLGIKDTNRKKLVQVTLDNGKVIEVSLARFKYSKAGKIQDAAKLSKLKNNKKHLITNKARIDFLEGLIKNLFTYVKKNPDSKPAIVMFFKDGSKHQNHVLRYLAPLVGAAIDPKTGKFLEVEITEEHGQPQNEINTMILDLLLNDNSTINDINDLMKFIRSSYSQWGLQLVHDNKVTKAGYVESTPKQFYEEVLQRLYEGKLDYLPDGVLLPIFRYLESGFPLNTYYMFEVDQTITEFFGVDIKNASEIDIEYLASIQNELIKQILLGKIDIKTAKQKMKNVTGLKYKRTSSQSTRHNNMLKAFNKQAELIRKQNKEIQADLEKRGYKFKRTGQTPAEMIKIIEEDLKKRGYTSSGTVSSSEFKKIGNWRIDTRTKEGRDFIKDMESIPTVSSSEPSRVTRGMSTFDFDETLIIDGENFVVATDPKTDETINIKSGDWPIRGPELAAAGYTFNFDDFVNVRGGVEGPLLQKMRNQIEKYGASNVFVLTARPQTADSAIHGWLKSKGINIPFKNITGLADSTGQAKADWMLEKFAEGYNDMYFVDDAMPNVDAVKRVLDQLDIKSKVVQAKLKFKRTASHEFNQIIEESKGTKAERVISYQEALKMGRNKNWFRLFVPPSAEDFKGLLYRFLGKGRLGDKHMAWFKNNLLDPFAKGIKEWNTYKQSISEDYRALRKGMPDVKKMLNKKVPGTIFTVDSAIRVYLWNKAGFEIPGITLEMQNKLLKYVEDNPMIQSFADALGSISRVKEGYSQPSQNWSLETIATDLNNIVNKIGRKQFLREYLENVQAIFTPDNMNKIQALYGVEFREALENILYRMENGTNRLQSNDRNVNAFLGWINGSIGAIMFFNMRSALLQTISTVNFVNWSDNNIFKASKAFANQPQFWKDFAMLFNSDQLKQRRKGLQTDVSASELANTFAEGGNTYLQKANSVIKYLLQIGFTPTQVADSFAIALGGASFYRNRFETYKKQGLSDAQAKDKAMLDFQEIAEETQQSSREDLISQQQASVLGRLILAFQNVTMQYTRLTKKALSDLVNRRGDMKTNVSKLIYYGMVQNLVFGALQSALVFILFGHEEEDEKTDKKIERVANGALDSLLRGTGIYGAIAAAIKNTALRYQAERQKGWGRDDGRTIVEALQLSPPIGSKIRKIYNALKTEQYNKGVSKEIGARIENPNLVAISNVVEALTNIPVARIVKKANNVEEAVTGNHAIWQRVALFMGWSRWDIGVKDEELEAAKKAVKDKRKREKNKGRVRCTATKKSGGRCKNTTNNSNKRCYAHQ